MLASADGGAGVTTDADRDGDDNGDGDVSSGPFWICNIFLARSAALGLCVREIERACVRACVLLAVLTSTSAATPMLTPTSAAAPFGYATLFIYFSFSLFFCNFCSARVCASVFCVLSGTCIHMQLLFGF